jgi:hypothetical protein
MEEVTDFYNRLEEKRQDSRETRWIYRGQNYSHENKDKKPDESELTTSLERAFKNFNINGEDRLKMEKDIIREFQRKLHLYARHTPAKKDLIGWLALMQHHGAPTRLLDWIYSFWVALYFAINKLKQNEVGEI